MHFEARSCALLGRGRDRVAAATTLAPPCIGTDARRGATQRDTGRGPPPAPAPFPPGVASGGRLVDAEMVGDELHVQKPKDEQRERDHADECEHNQDGARESVGREVSRATWLPPSLFGRWGRFGFRFIVGHGLSLSPRLRVDTSGLGVGLHLLPQPGGSSGGDVSPTASQASLSARFVRHPVERGEELRVRLRLSDRVCFPVQGDVDTARVGIRHVGRQVEIAKGGRPLSGRFRGPSHGCRRELDRPESEIYLVAPR
jgi:hypothetical protein